MEYCEHCRKGFIPGTASVGFFCSKECKELNKKRTIKGQKNYWLQRKKGDVTAKINYLKKILNNEVLSCDANFKKTAKKEILILTKKLNHINKRFAK